jgi:hypothetical protein
MATRKPSLEDGHGFCQPTFTGQAGCLEHVDVCCRVHGLGPVVEGRGAKQRLPLSGSERVGQA